MSVCTRRAASLIALVAWLAGTNAAAPAEQFHSNPRAGVEYYLRTYGRVSPARIPETYAVFARVLQVADKAATVTPELIVVDDREQAAAFVLADGSIVLSQRALELIGTNVDRTEADARLAFVLGHELAHLADNDFWDHQVSESLLKSSTAREIHRVLGVGPGQQQKELKADDQGFLYAALAGYRVERLIRVDGSRDFLSFWIDQIGSQDDDSYPSPANRTELLRVRLAERSAALENFRFGVRLIHFGRYREGIALLREFQRQFPGREVFNDLGYAYLHLALEQLPPEQAYHYWLPTWSDLDTPLATLNVRGSAVTRATLPIPAPVRENLLQAANQFELAIARDARYVPAHLNLASTHLLLGMAPAARTSLIRAELAIAAAEALAPGDAGVRVLAAIVSFERRRDGGVGEAITLDTREPTLAYDLARVNATTPAIARRYWLQVLAQFDTLPMRLATVLCREPEAAGASLADEIVERCSKLTAARSVAVPWPLPMTLGRDLLDKPLTTSELARAPWRIAPVAGGKVFANDDASVLALDDITALAVLLHVKASPDSLIQCCGQPHIRTAASGATLWHYGKWIAVVRDDAVDEIWVAN
jgi:tetratricopeptide (TPR) repeat protein